MESIHERVKREREAALGDAAKVRAYREYAEGDQRGTISAEQKRILGEVVGNDFADNVCDLALSTAASRLELTGFDVADGAEVETDFLADLYTKNQLGDLQYDVHYRTTRDGNHALGLRWLPDDRRRNEATDPDAETPPTRSSGRVTVHHEPWWDGRDTGVFVAYDEAGAPAYAVKDFSQVMGDPPRPRLRRTIYFPDHLERYLKDGDGWAAFALPSDPPNGIVPWTKADGTPLGIPIIHFPNGRFGRAPYGASDLAGGVLGLQDELNDLQRDITAAGRLTAYQMLTVTGAKIENLRVGPGRVIGSERADARIGAIPAGDMSQLLAGHAMKLATIARNTATPIHLIAGGDWPSGAALLRAEMPLVAKVQRMGKTIGPAWATLAHRATEIANAFGGLRLDEAKLITAVFAPPEKLDAQTLADIDKARVGVYAALAMLDDPVLIRKTGLLTEDEVTAMVADRTRRAAESVAVIAEF